MSKARKAAKEQAKVAAKKLNDEQVVKMKFSEDKFYSDPTKVHFEKGKVYEIVGADQIQRWVKRGGEIVSGELSAPEAVDNPSVVHQNKHNELNPHVPVVEEPKAEEPAKVDIEEVAGDIEEIQEDEI